MQPVKLYTDRDRVRVSAARAELLTPANHSSVPGLQEYRTEFRRDYARLVHSPSFRRLNRKRQLLPNDDSDFFRNRLTHSIEVAQIAKSIALKLNSDHLGVFCGKSSETNGYLIDTDLVECAALAHDIGHPPFGHTGEKMLSELMTEYGGFEGNAQTLRILARLEKKVASPAPEPGKATSKWGKNDDPRIGLDLTYRTLASVLKYDSVIEETNNKLQVREFKGGYYESEQKLVAQIKEHVAPGFKGSPFKTLECAIMDVADDIAYSTYDIEDAYKAKLLSPIELVSAYEKMTTPTRDEFNRVVCRRVLAVYPDCDRDKIVSDAREVLTRMTALPQPTEQHLSQGSVSNDPNERNRRIVLYYTLLSQGVCESGDARVGYTSDLVNRAIDSIILDYNDTHPALSSVRLKYEDLVRVETFKMIAWLGLIDTRKLRIIERRERMIIKTIFDALNERGGEDLLPEDHKELFVTAKDKSTRMRVLCDYISGMTDRYAEGFFHRLRRRDDSIFLPF